LKLAQTVKNFNSPIKNFKRTGKNLKPPNNTPTNGGKPQFTEQKLKQTVKNVKLPIETRTNDEKRRKRLHQHTTTPKP